MTGSNNPFEGSYDPSDPNDQVRQLRDNAWNVHAAQGEFEEAIDKLRSSLDVPQVAMRELNQSLAYEARVRWLKGEDELAVSGIRRAISDMKHNRRLEKSEHPLKRDQYEDHNLPWAAAIEATSRTGSRWRAIRHAAFGVVSAVVSQSPLFRREVDPNASRTKEIGRAHV